MEGGLIAGQGKYGFHQGLGLQRQLGESSRMRPRAVQTLTGAVPWSDSLMAPVQNPDDIPPRAEGFAGLTLYPWHWFKPFPWVRAFPH